MFRASLAYDIYLMHGATPAFRLWFVYLFDIYERSCTTVGAEGKARVLFGPKTKTGPRAADLLVVGSCAGAPL